VRCEKREAKSVEKIEDIREEMQEKTEERHVEQRRQNRCEFESTE
jgi:hypothetical protein